MDSVLIWNHLVDSSAQHILSTIALGFTYKDNDKGEAVRYFGQTGEDGPHQASPDSPLVGHCMTDVATEL